MGALEGGIMGDDSGWIDPQISLVKNYSFSTLAPPWSPPPDECRGAVARWEEYEQGLRDAAAAKRNAQLAALAAPNSQIRYTDAARVPLRSSTFVRNVTLP